MAQKTHPPSESRGLSRPLRMAITAFLIWNLFAIVTWCVPLESPLIARCRTFVRPYLVDIGLFQKWDMFAPDPSKINNYVGALIVYHDGTGVLWNFPRMEKLGYIDKYLNERYRKYANDCLFLDANAGLWPDAARYVARLNNRPGNAVESVALMRYWQIVPPPGPHGEMPDTPWNHYLFFKYDVAAGDLP